MPSVIFDTSVFISYKAKLKAIPESSFVSIVVIQELMAGARDNSELKSWEATAKGFERIGRLLVPTSEDWLLAGRALNYLLRGLKSKRSGNIPKLHPDEKQRIIRDVLIARTVRRAGGLLITNNISDFRKIKKFCNVSIQKGSEFFGS